MSFEFIATIAAKLFAFKVEILEDARSSLGVSLTSSGFCSEPTEFIILMEQRAALDEEGQDLLCKEAVEPIVKKDAFFSPLFVVPKKDRDGAQSST